MGRVYLAEHVRMGRMSAVKVMSPSLAPTADAIGRFNREAANASRINHPNVAAIYDFGESTDGTLYLAMEYVEGQTLSALLKREGHLPPPRVARITRQIAAALDAAHRLGIIHRDLKPDNVLVTRDHEGNEHVKVVDFGIARTAAGSGQTVTVAGVSVGTPEYMSPEQFAGGELDVRSDIYSLGIVVYAMLTGAVPFPDLSSTESLVQRLTERPRALADVAPHTDWPPRLQVAMDRALSPDPEERYRKVTDFALDVSAAVGESDAIAGASTRPMNAVHMETAARSSLGGKRPDTPPRLAAQVAVVRGKSRMPIALAAGAVTIGLVVLAVMRFGTSTPPAPVAAAPAPAPVMQVSADTSRVARGTAHEKAKHAVVVPPKAVHASPPAAVKSVAVAAAKVDSAAATPTVSAAVPDTAGIAQTQADARVIMQYFNRAEKAFVNRQGGKAMEEFRTGYAEYMQFARDHPAAPATAALGQRIKRIATNALPGCQALRDSLAALNRRGFQCDGLERATTLAPLPGEEARSPGQPLQQRRRLNRAP